MLTTVFHIPDGVQVLLSHSADTTDAQRFENAFSQVWGRLPEVDRSAIVALWRRDGGLTIAVMEDWPGRGQRSAECINPGDMLRFFEEHTTVMPDHVLHFTIAHELAHAYLLASDDPSHQQYFSAVGTEEDREQCERAVDDTMSRWGLYDRDAFAWGAANLGTTDSKLK